MRAWQLALEQARLLVLRSSHNYQSHSFNSPHNLYGMNMRRPDLAFSQNAVHRAPAPGYPLYGHLPSSYIPAFTDGSMTYVPTHSQRMFNPYSHLGGGFPNAPTSRFPPNPDFSGLSSIGAGGGTNLPPRRPIPSVGQRAPDLQVPCPRPAGRDVAMGMLAGAAVGTMMWRPYFWW